MLYKYSAAISKIFLLTYCNILDSKAEYPGITLQYLDITTEYIRRLSHSWKKCFSVYFQSIILFSSTEILNSLWNYECDKGQVIYTKMDNHVIKICLSIL